MLQTPAMTPIKQSVCYPIFQSELPLTDLFARIADIGFDAVELWSFDERLPEIVATAARHGLRVASVTGHGSIDDGLNNPAHHARIEGELTRTIEVCADLGIPGAICFSGARYRGVSDIEGMTIAARCLSRLAAQAENRGVNLNLELLNSRVDHFNYMGDSTEWCVALCQMVASPRVKILYDVYHAQIMEGDLIRNLTKCLPYLGHVHTGGNPGRAEIDESQEINYAAIMNVLAQADYAGYVGHEFFPKNPDKLASLRRAYEICHGHRAG